MYIFLSVALNFFVRLSLTVTKKNTYNNSQADITALCLGPVIHEGRRRGPARLADEYWTLKFYTNHNLQPGSQWQSKN